MAHFAQLDENNIVLNVIVVNNNDILNEYDIEDENIGIDFCKKIFGQNTHWKQTSYNNKIRVRYAAAGFTYNEEFDAFIPPKPFDSWILDETKMDWTSPLGNPPEITEKDAMDGYLYFWNENLYLEDNTKGWVFDNINFPIIKGEHGISTNQHGKSIIIHFNKQISNQINQNILDSFTIILNGVKMDNNFISKIELDKEFLIMNLNTTYLIKMTDDIIISYDKEKIPTDYRLKSIDQYEVKSFNNYQLTNTSKQL